VIGSRTADGHKVLAEARGLRAALHDGTLAIRHHREQLHQVTIELKHDREAVSRMSSSIRAEIRERHSSSRLVSRHPSRLLVGGSGELSKASSPAKRARRSPTSSV